MALNEITTRIVDELNAKFVGKDFEFASRNFTAVPGIKYDKVLQSTDMNRNMHSIHLFVERETGNVFKAASYKVPAKGVRYTAENIQQLIEDADVHGGYLYKRL